MHHATKKRGKSSSGQGKPIGGFPPAIGEPIKKTPGTEVRSGTRFDFQFPNYTESRVEVKGNVGSGASRDSRRAVRSASCRYSTARLRHSVESEGSLVLEASARRVSD